MTQTITSIARHNPIRTGVFAIVGVIALGVIAGFALGYSAPSEASAQVVVLPGVTVTAPPVVVPPPVIVPVVPVITPPVVTLPGVTVTGPRTGGSTNDDPFGPPCCTPPPVDPPPVEPPVVDDDPFGPPCCTEPTGPTPPVLPPVVPPVVPPVPPTPPIVSDAICVSLKGSASVITPGQAVTLSWKTLNATSISIDNGVGEVTPVGEGSVVVYPTQNTTYTATVTGASSADNCQTAVVVTTNPPPAQCVFLTGTPTVINAGDPVRLAWKTLNANSISIDNGVGVVSPTAEGFVIVNPTQTTTYIATVTGATGSVNCQATVTVTTIEQGPMCVSLSANRTSIDEGESVILSWVTSNASSVSIDNGVGVVTPTSSGSVTVTPGDDTTYTATVPNAPSNVNCRVSISVDEDGGGGGGGGGGGRRSARVGLESFVPELEEPLSFVYLSEVPYTGLELGTWGTVLYWLMLIGWSAALAYLVLFNAVPFALARAKRFGGSVKEALQTEISAPDNHSAPVVHASAHATDHGHDAHAPAPVPTKPEGYNAHDGFRSFAAGAGLTIDDIVKGLSREIEQKHQAPAHAEILEAVRAEAPTPAPAAPRYVPTPTAAPVAAPMNEDVRDFIAALLNGDRDTVFGMIRSMARQGQDTEAFVSHAACALDDAYRACIDGTTCHPDIAELTNGCHPSYLERLVASLTSAVDGSYSAGMTGVKMALTRALGVVAG